MGSTNRWTATHSLIQARQGAASAVMYDGSVLVTGGIDQNGDVLATAERYQSDGMFHPVAPMSVPRTGHAAIWLADGFVLVTGGKTKGGDALSSAEMYDPVANRWTTLPAMGAARTGHTATQLPDGSVLIAGGTDGAAPLKTMERFNLVKETFTTANFLFFPRTGHAAAALMDGRVLIVGGTDANGRTLAATEIFDPSSDAIAAGPALATPRTGASATTLVDGTVLIAGGSYPEGAPSNNNVVQLQSAELFTPATQSMATLPVSLHYPRSGHQAFLLPHNGNVLFVGGSFGGFDLKNAELYTPWRTKFADVPSMAVPRTEFVGAAPEPMVDGLLLIAGGKCGDTTMRTAELFGYATLKTDKPDYAPGQKVTIAGSGWKPRETVTLSFRELQNVDTPPVLTVVADANGNFTDNSFAPDRNDLDVRFYLTAKGSTSEAQITFTDANINSVTVGTQTPSPVNAGSSATFPVTFSGVAGTLATLSVTNGLPVGATASFSPNPVDVSSSSTMTITTTANSTPGGTSTLTIQATGGGSTVNTTKSLVVAAATTTALSLSLGTNPSTYGYTLTFKAVVTTQVGSSKVTGTLNFQDGGTYCGDPVGNVLSSKALSGTPGNTTAAVVPLSAGTHTIWACYLGSSSFAPSSDSMNQTVNPKALTISGLVASSKTYDGTNSATITGTPTLLAAEAYNAGTAADGKPFSSDSVTVSGPATGTFATKNVGTGITVTVSGLTLGGTANVTNYTITAPTPTASITVASLSITAASDSKTYGQTKTYGSGSSAFTSSGLPNGETIGSVTLGSTGGVATAAVGSYNITPSAATGGTFTPSNYSITYNNGTLTVSAAALSITANNDSKTYGQTRTYGAGSSSFISSGLQNGETIGSVTISASGGTAANAAVASYTLTPSAATGGTFSASNYTITYKTGTLSVGQAALSITSNDSKTYGQTRMYGAGSSSFTSSGLQNGETIGSVTITASGGTAANAAVGSYTLTPSAATGGTFTASNYLITYNPGVLTVSAASLSITANDDTKTYGQTRSYGAGFSAFTTSGLQNGETIGSVTLSVNNNGGAAAAPVGSYAITPSAATGGTFTASNYSITYKAGTLTVIAASLTITANGDSKTYGQTRTYGAGSLAFTTSGFQNGETVGTVTITASGGTAANAAVGTYSLAPSAATGGTFNASNYSITYNPGTLTVNPAVLNITSNDSKAYGQAKSYGIGSTVFTAAGLQNGETIGSVTVTASGGTAANAAVGSYTLTPSAATGGTFSSGNYTITYTPGLLTVSPAALIVTANSDTKVYGQTRSYGSGSSAFTASGLQNGEAIGSVTLSDSNNGGLPTAPVGTYTLTPSAATGGTFTASNYTITYHTGTLTVSAAQLTITINSTSKTYGQTITLGTAGFTASGLVNTDTVTSVTLTSAGTAAGATVAGSPYPISGSNAQGSGLSNYNIAYVPGSLTVGPVPLTITALNQTKKYGETLNLGSTLFTYSGLVNGDSVSSVTLTSSGAFSNATVAGSPYPIVASAAQGNGIANYTITYVAGSLTVTKATAAIAFSGLYQLYSGNPLPVGVTVTPSVTYSDTYSGIAPTNYPTNATPPVSPGSYTVAVTVSDPNYGGSANAVFIIATLSASPVLLYSDLDSAPATGGENGDGAWVCVYGENFGPTQGNSIISIGGVPAAQYKVWTDPGRPYHSAAAIAKACAQISHTAIQGQTLPFTTTIQLTTSQGPSNSLPFTLRSGTIRWVTTSGNDSTGDGTQGKPWQTIVTCKNSMQPGDICLIGDGVNLSNLEDWEAELWLNSSGTPGNPKAIVAYPGANVQISGMVAQNNGHSSTWAASGQLQGINNYNGGSATCGSGGCSYWTIAGFSQINGSNGAISLINGSNVRLVDNDILCQGAYCDGSSAGLVVAASNVTALGNRLHSIGCHEDVDYSTSQSPCSWVTPAFTITTSAATLKFSGPATGIVEGDVIEVGGQLARIIQCNASCMAGTGAGLMDIRFPSDFTTATTFQYRDFVPNKEWHSAYFQTGANDIDFGWNSIDGTVGRACRGVLFNSAGASLFDLHVHDNLIHDTACDGITFATVDPSQGTVEAYNNVLFNVGEGNGTPFNGGDPVGGTAHYACIYSPGYANGSAPGTGEIAIYNNTLYNCGSRVTLGNATGLTGALAINPGASPGLLMLASNNILSAADPAEVYLQDYYGVAGSGMCKGAGGSCSDASSNNVFYGSTASTVPTYLTNNIVRNPNFANAPSDFRMFSGNPAAGAATASQYSANDINGVSRSSSNPTPGAYEYIANAPTTSRGLYATSTTIASLYNPQLIYSRSVFNIQVAPQNSGLPTPTGQIALYDGTRRLGIFSLDENAAAYYVTWSLYAGNHTIYANYLGDQNYSPSYASIVQTIQQAVPVLSTHSLTFSAPLGTVTAAQTVTVSNSGTGPVVLGTISSNSAEFLVTNNNCVSGGAGVTLGNSQSCTFDISFAPTIVSSAARGAVVSVAFANGLTAQTVLVHGTVILPTYTVSTLSPFSAPLGGNSSSQTVTVKNTGTVAALTVNALTVSGSTPAFLISNNLCLNGSAPLTLTAGSSCTFDVVFHPTLAYTTQVASLTVGVAKLATNKAITLTGDLVVPTYTVTVSQTSFAQTMVGTTGETHQATVANTGAYANLTITKIVAPPNWVLVADSGSTPCTQPLTLVPGATCTIGIAFKPGSAGPKTGPLTVVVAAPATYQEVILAGTAVAPITVSAGSVAFGYTMTGSSSQRAITLTNPANNPSLTNLSVQFTGSSDFSLNSSVSGSCGDTVSGGTSATTCTLNLVYAPPSTEVKGTVSTGTAIITATSGAFTQSKTVPLSGKSY